MANKVLPPNVLALIKEYSKPQSHHNWKTNPKLTFIQFYYELKNSKKRAPFSAINKIQNGYNNLYVYYKYMTHLKIYTQKMALNIIEAELGIEPHIVIMMNKYYLDTQ